VIEAQQASFVESERRQLLRTVAVELEEVPRARSASSHRIAAADVVQAVGIFLPPVLLLLES
jgi:hypothetical protein